MTELTTPRPMAMVAELTYLCPLKCPYCSNPLHLGRYREELDTEQWRRVLGEAAALGVVQTHFSGGEPLVRRDLESLVAKAREEDMYTHLSTSGVLATETRLKSLRDAGLDAIQLSLLGDRAEENDRFGGRKSFGDKQAAASAAIRIGFSVTLNVVLHRGNLDRLEGIIELAREWKVDRLELAHVQYYGWAFRNRAALLPTREQFENSEAIVEGARQRLEGTLEIIHVLPDYFQTYPKTCLDGWGRVFVYVAPDGAVLPCLSAREIPDLEFPNVRDQSLESIWYDAPVFNRFRGTGWLPEPCRSCDRKEIDYGGCRCQAYLLTGDSGATDPVCHLAPTHGLIQEALDEAERSPGRLVYREIEN